MVWMKIIMVGAMVGAAGAAEPEPQPVPAPAPSVQPAKDAAKEPAKEPTLDELLGLTPAAPAAAPTEKPPSDAAPADGSSPPPTPAQADLNRKLSGEAEEDEFTRAVALMGDAAKRLKDAKDPGLATQRMQEDVLKALDKLISDAQKNQSKSKSQQQKQQQQQSQNQPSPSSQKSSQPAQKSAASPEAGMPQIPREDGPGRTRAGNAASWGDLPARVRDALVEGINDRFSARYRQKTEEYYKRLAEDKKGGGSN